MSASAGPEASRALQDEGISSLLGFIVAMVVVVAAMATVVYMISAAPEAGTSEETRDLQGAALRTAETLTRSPGQPEDWHNVPLEDIQRVGLAKTDGSRIASLDKIEMIRNGTLTGQRIAQRLGVEDQGLRMNVTGRTISVPLVTAPPSETYAVAHFGDHSNSFPGNVKFDIAKQSKADLERFEAANEDFDAKVHDWEFKDDRHPSIGIGNTVPDHAWFIETQLFPKMAGLAGTHATWNDLNDSTSDGAEWSAFSSYGSNLVNRFHITEDLNPINIHGTVPSGEHIMTVAFNDNPADPSGLGPWQTVNGGDAWALIGPVGVTGASDLAFNMTHKLKLPNATEYEGSSFPEPCYDTGFDEDCWALRPSIKYWNATAGQWTNVRGTVNCDGTLTDTGWHKNATKIATGGAWKVREINLCEATEHAEGELWVALHWDMWCNDGTLGRVNCDSTRMPRSWFLDDLSVEADGSAAWSTDFEPLSTSGRETVLVSSGVNHTRTYDQATSIRQENAMHYFDDFVQAGGSVISLATDDKGRHGDWLAEIGLEAIKTDSAAVETVSPDNILMRMPWNLPNQHSDYQATELGWQKGITTHTVTGASPTNALDTVQQITTGSAATLVRGEPFGDQAGRVVAIGYNLSEIDDDDLADHLVQNTYAATMFLDPAFETDAASARPEPGTDPVQTARRVMLVPVTADEVYQVPIEVTVYVWPESTVE